MTQFYLKCGTTRCHVKSASWSKLAKLNELNLKNGIDLCWKIYVNPGTKKPVSDWRTFQFFFRTGRHSCCKLCSTFERVTICSEREDGLNIKNEEILSFLFRVIFQWLGNWLYSESPKNILRTCLSMQMSICFLKCLRSFHWILGCSSRDQNA